MFKENVKYFDAVLAGMPKCGSTTLITYFHQHPKIYVPWDESRGKDPRYTDSKWNPRTGEIDNKLPNKKMIFREEHLANKREDREKLYELNSDISLIFTFRDPVKRAYSAYWHLVRNEGWKKPFKDVFEYDRSRKVCIQFGEYSSYLEDINKFNDQNKFYIISEEFWNDTETVLKDLYSFLKLDYISPSKIHRNPGGAPRSEFVNDLVTGNIRIPVITDNNKLLKIIRKGVNIFNLKDYPEMDKEMRKKLIEYYKEKNEGLDEMIDKDLSKWWDWWK